MRDKNIILAVKIAEAVCAVGGRAYYVGGAVRDEVLGRENKDIDIEIHGISVEKLEEILSTLGEVIKMGISFGVYGMRHYDIDIALPRSTANRDIPDPLIGIEAAARRRDFTVNAMMKDVLTGEIIDLFNGRRDIEKGIIRHVSDETFAEDALRVLRAAQFASRFGWTIAEETVELCKTLEITQLASERVLAEIDKALMKSARPSVFFNNLVQMNHAEWTQNADTEGVDRAAALKRYAKNPRYFMFAATGIDLSKFTDEIDLLRYSDNIRALKDETEKLYTDRADADTCCALFDKAVCPEDLILFTPEAAWDFLRDNLRIYNKRMALPFVQGRDLISAGFAPGKRFGEVLAYAHALRLKGVAKEEALKRTIERMIG